MSRKKEVLINVSPGETRVALIEDDRLGEVIYDRARPDDDAPSACRLESHVNSIVLGRVTRVLPGVQAAFVEIGLERAGFLSAREARRIAVDYMGEEANSRVPHISELVREGDEVLVQIIKDPIGDKGARLTAGPTLPGRHVVMVPNSNLAALSRRIENEEDRERLLAVIARLQQRGRDQGIQSGFIARTAALDATEHELEEDADRLWQQWREIMERRAKASPPTHLHRNLGILALTLRDHVDRDTVRVLIDDATAFGEAKRYAQSVLPDLAERIELYQDKSPLFGLYNVEDEIDQSMEGRASLPSGGWITVETTEAMTSIDVNSGSLEAGCLAETALRTNLEAAHEIARQLRLRGIGGLIVADFIHLETPECVEKVMGVLRAAFARDRTPVQITEMSEFGLVEITRKRVREPLGRLLTGACPTCRGQGRIRSAGTVANDVLRRVQAEAQAAPGRAIRVRVAPEVGAWIMTRSHSVLEPLRERFGQNLKVDVIRHYARERFDVEAVREPA